MREPSSGRTRRPEITASNVSTGLGSHLVWVRATPRSRRSSLSPRVVPHRGFSGPASEAATGKNSLGRTAEVRLPHGFVDLSSGGRGHRTKLRHKVSPRPRLEVAAWLGLELSEVRAASPRTGRKGNPPLAQTGLAADKKQDRPKLLCAPLAGTDCQLQRRTPGRSLKGTLHSHRNRGNHCFSGMKRALVGQRPNRPC